MPVCLITDSNMRLEVEAKVNIPFYSKLTPKQKLVVCCIQRRSIMRLRGSVKEGSLKRRDRISVREYVVPWCGFQEHSVSTICEIATTRIVLVFCSVGINQTNGSCVRGIVEPRMLVDGIHFTRNGYFLAERL